MRNRRVGLHRTWANRTGTSAGSTRRPVPREHRRDADRRFAGQRRRLPAPSGSTDAGGSGPSRWWATTAHRHRLRTVAAQRDPATADRPLTRRLPPPAETGIAMSAGRHSPTRESSTPRPAPVIADTPVAHANRRRSIDGREPESASTGLGTPDASSSRCGALMPSKPHRRDPRGNCQAERRRTESHQPRRSDAGPLRSGADARPPKRRHSPTARWRRQPPRRRPIAARYRTCVRQTRPARPGSATTGRWPPGPARASAGRSPR